MTQIVATGAERVRSQYGTDTRAISVITLGQARAMASDQFDVSDLEGRGKTSARILLAAPPRGAQTGLSEYELCTSQFLYPTARLLRMITRLSNSEWTRGMRRFVADYSGLLLHDHLLRNLYEIKLWNALLSCTECSKVELWENAAVPHSQLLPPSKRMFLDTDLWYGATVAELLGAHANNREAIADRNVRATRAQRLVVGLADRGGPAEVDEEVQGLGFVVDHEGVV